MITVLQASSDVRIWLDFMLYELLPILAVVYTSHSWGASSGWRQGYRAAADWNHAAIELMAQRGELGAINAFLAASIATCPWLAAAEARAKGPDADHPQVLH